MSTLEKMSGHTRLHRRGATYYHRCIVPKDIFQTYGKVEETFSIHTKDYSEALKLVRIEAVRVDRRFEAHRLHLADLSGPQQETLSDTQIKDLSDQYFRSLLDEDDDTRLDGFVETEADENGGVSYVGPPAELPRPTFREYEEVIAANVASTREVPLVS